MWVEIAPAKFEAKQLKAVIATFEIEIAKVETATTRLEVIVQFFVGAR